MRRFVVVFCFLWACTSRPVVVVRSPPTPEHDRKTLFDSLVADVRAHHVFAAATEKNLGRKWDDDLPALAREFADAKTDDALAVALTHFVNALHDGHCTYEPEGKPTTVTLPIRADVEWREGKPVFYVSRVDDAVAKTLASPGDEIRSVDGVPAAELVTKLMLVSHQNNLRGVARDVAEYLTRRKSTAATTVEGETSSWVVGSKDVTLRLQWAKASSHSTFDEWAINYDVPTCSSLTPRDYGPYEVSARGEMFCVYGSHVKPYSDYPIVREFSFRYIESPDDVEHVEHRIRADHDILEHELARLKPKGVLLDLRDNGGGNNPNWFMDWWASGPYVDRFVLTRDNGELGKPRPFFCKRGDCAWDNRYTPTHRVTTSPVALLVGSRCVSSCDSVAQLFAENHFGPLVGEPTAAAFTTKRARHPVTFRGKPFGAINLAITRELSGVTHEAIEGIPIHLDVPIDRTFSNRDGYDRLLVEGAIKALH